MEVSLFDWLFGFGLGFGRKFWLRFGQRFGLDTLMKPAHRLFHDRSKTDANELALVVVGLIDE